MLVFFLPEFSGDSSFNWRNLSYWFNKSFWWCQFTWCTICISLTAASACNFVQFFFGSAKTIPATMVYWQKTFSNLAARSLPKLQYRTVINFWRCLFVWMVFWLHFVDTNFGKFWKKKRVFIFQIISKNAFGQISQVANKKKEEEKNTCRNFCLLCTFTWKAQ